MKQTLFAITLACTCFISAQAVSPKGAYKVINKISVEGDEKWDYLFSDDKAGLLYVSHGSMVQVVDETKKVVVGKITGMKGVHGIAIAPEFSKGFITSGKDSSVVIFNTKTYETIKKVKVNGAGPDAIIYDAFSKKVFVFNAKSNNANVIDAASNEIIANIAFSGNPEAAESDGKGYVFVNLESASSIAVINATTNKVENIWSLAPGTEPTGLALDNENHRLFSTCANKLMVVVDAESGKVVSTLPIGDKPDGAAFDPTYKVAFSSNGGDMTLTVIKEESKDKFSVMENMPTQKGAKTIAINKLTHHIYLPTARFEASEQGEKPKVIPNTFVILEVAAE
jgi:YVTN family beta-propeller protein